MQAQVSEEVKSARLQRLQDVLVAQQKAFNASQIGKTLPVLVSGLGRKTGQMHGRSPYLQAVHFDHDRARIGDIMDVRVIGASQNSLTGERLDALAPA
jgi:tRNA-2-methylthio-N6-dimethylallyladenosine synthase